MLILIKFCFPLIFLDWFPTLMGLATEGEWSGGYSGHEIDGVDVWDALTSGSDSPREEILHYSAGYNSSMYCIQYNNYKLNYQIKVYDTTDPDYVFTEDLYPGNSETICLNPSLVDDQSYGLSSTSLFVFTYFPMSPEQVAVAMLTVTAAAIVIFFSYLKHSRTKYYTNLEENILGLDPDIGHLGAVTKTIQYGAAE
jgi:hypothetical protein